MGIVPASDFCASGYYEVDTAIVRETMKVVVPPITDMSIVGKYIARECQDLPTYMLKKENSSSGQLPNSRLFPLSSFREGTK
jgi:hypothetical protein